MKGGAKRRVRTEENLNAHRPDIIEAALKNSLVMAESALTADPSSINMVRDGQTAMHIAVAHGNYSMVQYLLKQPDIDLSVKDPAGRDCLDLAILVGHPLVKDSLFRARARELEMLPPLSIFRGKDGPS